jgi:hypothetical protein
MFSICGVICPALDLRKNTGSLHKIAALWAFAAGPTVVNSRHARNSAKRIFSAHERDARRRARRHGE